MKNKRITIFETAYREDPSRLTTSNTDTLWLPLVKSKTTESTLGINQDGDWVVEVSGDVRIIREQKSFLFCIVFLEMSFADIKNYIMDHTNGINQIADIGDIFPFVEIIRFVLETSTSDYWLELAMNWFNELNAAEKHVLTPALDEAVMGMYLHQKLKHRMQRELKKLKVST